MEVGGRWAGDEDLGPWRSRERAKGMSLQGEGQGVEHGGEGSRLLTHPQWLPDLKSSGPRC